MPLLHYATYFDCHYLTRGLALYHSLIQHSPLFTLWVLCLDETTEVVLRGLALPNIRLTPLVDLEQACPALLTARSNRTTVEYYWTLTPAWLVHLLDNHREIDLLTYLDADLYFYTDPAPLASAELGAGTILCTPMRRTPYAFASGPKSRFGVGFNMFRRSVEALSCLVRWREQCLAWCYDRFEPDRYGDQQYLNEWPERYSGFVASANLGLGVGPWNLGNYHLSAREGRPLVDDAPVIFFHFARLRIVRQWLFEPGFWLRRAPQNATSKQLLCVPYARALRRATRQARSVSSEVPPFDIVPRGLWHTSVSQMLQHRTFLIVTDKLAL